MKILSLDENLEFLPEKIISVPRQSNLLDLKKKVLNEFSTTKYLFPNLESVQILRVVQNQDKNMAQEIQVLSGDEKLLEKDFGVLDGSAIYVEKFPGIGEPSTLQKRFEMEV